MSLSVAALIVNVYLSVGTQWFLTSYLYITIETELNAFQTEQMLIRR